MKKLFTTLVLIAGLSAGAFAQYCYNGGGSPNGITPDTNSAPGLTPTPENLPCAVTGTLISDTIFFTNFTSFPLGGSNVHVDSLRIDSLSNIPAGLCWNTSIFNNTFQGGQQGVINVHGTCTANPGQYTLGIYITAWTPITEPLPTVGPDANAATLASLYYYTRVVCVDSTCPPVDTVDGKSTNAYLPYGSGVCPPTGIMEIRNNLSNVSVVPNPFNTSATVTFNSEVEGAFLVKMVNLLGEVVTSKSINVTHGSNTIDIERNNLSSGVYILTIGNGNGSTSKKVVIE